MKRIIVIGNGFDRAHGLDTSYGHFIKYLINGAINGDEKIVEELLDVNTLTLEHQNYEYIKSNFQSLNTASKKQIPKKLYFKNTFFKSLLTHHFEADWVDIEYLYYKSLNVPVPNHVDKLNSEFEIIKKHLEQYLFTHYESTEIELNTDFLDIFHEGNPRSLLFLNFNYTSTIELYLKRLNPWQIESRKIVYIHGELYSEDNPIIFGYGDDSEGSYQSLIRKNNNSYLKNLKRQQYNLADSHRKLKHFIDDSYGLEVYSIGHSLGLSDKTLLREVFDNAKVRTIKLFYYKGIEGYRNLNDNLRRIVSDNTFNNKIVNFPNSKPVPQIEKEN